MNKYKIRKKLKNVELIKAMREDGLALKKGLIDPSEDNDIMFKKEKKRSTEDESMDPEQRFVNSLTRKQKKMFLKKINILLEKTGNMRSKTNNKRDKNREDRRDKKR